MHPSDFRTSLRLLGELEPLISQAERMSRGGRHRECRKYLSMVRDRISHFKHGRTDPGERFPDAPPSTAGLPRGDKDD